MALPFTISTTGHTMGLIVLQSDETIENDFRSIFDQLPVTLLHSRIPNSTTVNEQTLKAMHAQMPKSAQLFPSSAEIEVVGYACTSGATMIGSNRVELAIQSILPQVLVTDPLKATKSALNALGAKNIGFVTPYIADVSAAMRQALTDNGQTISAFASFEQMDDSVVARIAPESILQGILHVAKRSACDAVFVACTNLQALSIIAEAEQRLNIPVLSSNQTLAWDMMRSVGIKPHPSQTRFGQIFNH